jgi:adenylate cyclase
VPDGLKMLFRVGVNLGDVMIDGDDIYGDGVNIAARLEALADAGGVCISQTVLEHVRDRIDVRFEDLGEQEVKNIARPVRVWRWIAVAGLAESKSSKMDEPLSLPDKPSIAVLPFDNMSGDPEQEYFADGITEDIITLLSKLRWLLVIARNSTFHYKGAAPDIRQVGQDLGVRYVLEGSVRKAGNRVRVAAQLIDASNGSHIWAENYDRELEDVFALQDDIARQISACLEPEIERAEWRGLADSQSPNLGSWDQYLRGLARMYEYNREGNTAAKNYFQKAIELEPEFGHAHAALAYVIYHDTADGYAPSREQAMRDAEDHAFKAVTADDQDAFAHCVLGRIYSIQRRFDEAISELQIAIKLNPSLALAHHGLGYALFHNGEVEQSIPLFETAEKLSPHDHNVWAFLGVRARAYIQLGDYAAAIRTASEAIRKPHAKFWANVTLVSALGHAGRIKEAQAAVDELMRRKPDFNVSFMRETVTWYGPENLEHYIDGLRKAGLPDD